MTADKRNIHQRLAAVMASVTYIQKEQKHGMKYTIVSHDKVTAKVRPALLKEGIVYYPVRCDHSHNGNRAECGMTIRFTNVDAPDDFFDVQTFGYGIDPQDKGPGKAMSYAVKYALLKALGLETGDDPDLDNIDHADEDPAITPETKRDELKAMLETCRTISQLAGMWKGHDFNAAWEALPANLKSDVEKEKDRLKAALSEAA